VTRVAPPDLLAQFQRLLGELACFIQRAFAPSRACEYEESTRLSERIRGLPGQLQRFRGERPRRADATERELRLREVAQHSRRQARLTARSYDLDGGLELLHGVLEPSLCCRHAAEACAGVPRQDAIAGRLESGPGSFVARACVGQAPKAPLGGADLQK